MSIKEWVAPPSTERGPDRPRASQLSVSTAGPLVFATWLPGPRVATLEEARRAYLEIENALQEVVLDFLAAGPEAQRRTKELLKRAQPLPGPELIDFTAEAIARARTSPEGRKGLEAFFSKAPPAWAARVEALRKSAR